MMGRNFTPVPSRFTAHTERGKHQTGRGAEWSTVGGADGSDADAR